jgi:hypothetical protein
VRRVTPWLALGLFLWASPLAAQETLRYDLSQPSLEYRVEIAQSMEVPLPGGASSQVRTDVSAKMVWTLEAERDSGDRVVKLAFTDFETRLTTGDREPQRHDHLKSLAPFELIIVLNARGQIQDTVFDVSNPARLRALSLFNDIVVRNFPGLPEEAVAPGATWEDKLEREVKDGSIDARGILARKFRLEAPGTVGFSGVGTLQATVTVDGVAVKRTTQLTSEGSGRFEKGVLEELAASASGSTAKTDQFGASKVLTTVKLKRVR